LRRRIETTNAELKDAVAAIEELAIHDDLTRAYNRRFMFDLLHNEKARADRGAPVFCLILLDLDHFKNINDCYGHLAGDEVLKDLAADIKGKVRELDAVSRYGGEEFVIILTNTTLPDAMTTAERIREIAERLPHAALPPDVRVTVSIGVTEYRPVEPVESALARADAALYRAKAGGRNRVEYEAPSERGQGVKAAACKRSEEG
jgi:diguanylate cyclase (GGDEF)-like protein